jgi:hypothetical protein
MARPKGDPQSRRSAGNLAWMLRQNLHEEVIYRWYLLILMGKNPRIVEDDRYKSTGGIWVVPDEDDARVPDGNRRDMAMMQLVNRRDGLPAQKVQIDAELQVLHAKLSGEISAGDLAALPPAALGRVVGALRGAIAGARALPAGDDEDAVPELLEGVDEDAAVIVAGPPVGARDAGPQAA